MLVPSTSMSVPAVHVMVTAVSVRTKSTDFNVTVDLDLLDPSVTQLMRKPAVRRGAQRREALASSTVSISISVPANGAGTVGYFKSCLL